MTHMGCRSRHWRHRHNTLPCRKFSVNKNLVRKSDSTYAKVIRNRKPCISMFQPVVYNSTCKQSANIYASLRRYTAATWYTYNMAAGDFCCRQNNVTATPCSRPNHDYCSMQHHLLSGTGNVTPHCKTHFYAIESPSLIAPIRCCAACLLCSLVFCII